MQLNTIDTAQPSTSSPVLGAVNAAGAQAQDSSAVDFQNFLQLLTAQLRNQDPLSPLDSTEFVAQLANFSSVEQLVTANQSLDAIAASLVGGGIEKYAGWIGRDAEAAAASVYFDGAPMRFRISGDPDASKVVAVISDEIGNEIARIPVQNSHEIQQWDGVVGNDAVAAGVYDVNVIYYRDDQQIRSEQANTFGIVTGVSLAGGGAMLRFEGGIEIDPSDIVSLQLAE